MSFDWSAEDMPSLLDQLRSQEARRQRLFVCAMCRQGWSLLTDDSQTAVVCAEYYADHPTAKAKRRLDHWHGVISRAIPDVTEASRIWANITAWAAAYPSSAGAIREALFFYNEAGSDSCLAGVVKNAFDDIIGDPHQRFTDLSGGVLLPGFVERPVDLEDVHALDLEPVRSWNDRTVERLARSIYEERDFDRLPILADACEEAGLACQPILEHFRGVTTCPECEGIGYLPRKQRDDPRRYEQVQCACCQGKRQLCNQQPHFHGCWALDLILGKE